MDVDVHLVTFNVRRILLINRDITNDHVKWADFAEWPIKFPGISLEPAFQLTEKPLNEEDI